MKKIISLLLGVLLIASVLAGCSSTGTNTVPDNSSTPATNSPDPSAGAPADNNPADSTSKVLIVYYSLTGTTERVAKAIQEKTGADLYLLEPESPYLVDHDAALDEMEAERTSGTIRGLNGTLPDISGYDIVLVGGPVWRGEPSNPVQKYLSLTDFTDKTVSGFWTAGANPGEYAQLFAEQVKGSEVVDGLSLVSADVSNSETLNSKIDAWLDAVGISRSN